MLKRHSIDTGLNQYFQTRHQYNTRASFKRRNRHTFQDSGRPSASFEETASSSPSQTSSTDADGFFPGLAQEISSDRRQNNTTDHDETLSFDIHRISSSAAHRCSSSSIASAKLLDCSTQQQMLSRDMKLVPRSDFSAVRDRPLRVLDDPGYSLTLTRAFGTDVTRIIALIRGWAEFSYLHFDAK